MIPTLSRLSVNTCPGVRLRLWCSFASLRILPLHAKFPLPLQDSRPAVSDAVSVLSTEISHLTYRSAYARFTPNKSEQRLHPSYYRGCWHEVSRCLCVRYRHHLPWQKSFTTLRPSSLTRHGWIRLSPIVQYSPLLPPVGVWTVSQFQCDGSSSQIRYTSSPW